MLFAYAAIIISCFTHNNAFFFAIRHDIASLFICYAAYRADYC